MIPPSGQVPHSLATILRRQMSRSMILVAGSMRGAGFAERYCRSRADTRLRVSSMSPSNSCERFTADDGDFLERVG